MSVLDRVSIADQIAEVKREIEMRKRVYIRLIDQKKMTPAEGERRATVMAAVLSTLEGVQQVDRESKTE
jgi:hypothetical protein